MKKTILALTVSSFLLMACGGSDSSSNNTMPTQPKIGVLTDGPVSGASYIINGITKTTNANGEFEYQEGDQIEFKIGGVSLGRVSGAARITPLELSNDNNTRLNLLIFLQSLDQNSDHGDGIQIPEAVNTTLNNQVINFEQPTDAFIAQFQPILHSLAGFEDKAVVTEQDARASFNQAFLKDIAGVWYAKNSESEIALQVNEDGRYLFGEAIIIDPTNSANGMEAGNLSIDVLSSKLLASTTIDTNEDWGLNDFGQPRPMTISFDGTQLHIAEAENPNENATFIRIPKQSSGLTGAWQVDTGKQLFVFNSNNTYFMVDPIGDDQIEAGEISCGGAGIEFGNYRLENNLLFIDVPKIDTNGCAGLSDTNGYLGIPVDIQSNTVTFRVSGEPPFSLKRLD